MSEGKVCNKCGVFQSYGNFNKDRTKKDGYATVCKPCKQTYFKTHCTTPEYHEQRKKKDLRYGQSEKGKINYRKYQKSEKGKKIHDRYSWSEKGKATKASYSAQYKNQYPKVIKAHYLFNGAVKSGKIIRPTACSKCPNTSKKIHGHHPDYDKPYDVVWLCSDCHSKEPTGINAE
jgi:hypothetical protein